MTRGIKLGMYVLLTCFVIACGKEKEEKAFQKAFMGHAFFELPLEQSEKPPLVFGRIDVHDPAKEQRKGALRRQIQTNRDGSFYLESPGAFPLVLYTQASFQINEIDMIDMYDSLVIESEPDTVLQLPIRLSDHNLLFLQVWGESGSLPGVQVEVYADTLQAEHGGGPLYQGSTDAAGYVILKEINEGLYYVRASLEREGLHFIRRWRSIQIPGKGMSRDTLRIGQPEGIYYNTWTCTVLDSLSYPLPGASIRLYSSPIMAARNNDYGVLYTMKTDQNGKVQKQGLPPGIYYVNATIELTQDTLLKSWQNQIQIPERGHRADTFIVR